MKSSEKFWPVVTNLPLICRAFCCFISVLNRVDRSCPSVVNTFSFSVSSVPFCSMSVLDPCRGFFLFPFLPVFLICVHSCPSVVDIFSFCLPLCLLCVSAV